MVANNWVQNVVEAEGRIKYRIMLRNQEQIIIS